MSFFLIPPERFLSHPVPAPSPFRSRQDRSREREAKRDAVLLTAVRMFNERGFHASSLDDVAAALGVSKPTIYHYLGNKEQVLIECVSRGLEALLEAVDASGQETGSGLDRLRRFLCRYSEIIMGDFGRCVVRVGDESLSSEGAAQFRARKREIDLALRRMIEAAIADGSMRPVDVRLTGFALAGALNWPARWHSASGPEQPPEIARDMVNILIDGLRPAP